MNIQSPVLALLRRLEAQNVWRMTYNVMPQQSLTTAPLSLDEAPRQGKSLADLKNNFICAMQPEPLNYQTPGWLKIICRTIKRMVRRFKSHCTGGLETPC
jgi:hypothetical protein